MTEYILQCSWDRLQPSHDPDKDKRKRMNEWVYILQETLDYSLIDLQLKCDQEQQSKLLHQVNCDVFI